MESSRIRVDVLNYSLIGAKKKALFQQQQGVSSSASRSDEHEVLPQSSRRVLLIRPTEFGPNEEAAADNKFALNSEPSSASSLSAAEIKKRALKEHAGLVMRLADEGVEVHVVSYLEPRGTPDACFPNNIFSSSHDGMLTLYPMRWPSRAIEKDDELIEYLQGIHSDFVDLSAPESETPRRALEGTGSLLLDHMERVAYLSVSERSNEQLAREWAAANGYEAVIFRAVDAAGNDIYHTNVVLCIGTRFAILCTECIPDAAEAAAIVERLSAGGKRSVIQVTRDQMLKGFCGNTLEVRGRSDAEAGEVEGKDTLLACMSRRAYNVLTPEQQAILTASVDKVIAVPFETIEDVGGGSVRCCIAELFTPLALPEKASAAPEAVEL